MLQNSIFQSKRTFCLEQCGRHFLKIIRDNGTKLHQIKNLRLQIDPRRNLGQYKSFLAQFKYRTFGDIVHFLVFFARDFAVVGNLLDLLYKLNDAAFAVDMQLVAVKGTLQSFSGKGRAENDMLCVSGDINKTAGPRRIGAKLCGVDITVCVDLARAHVGDINTGAVVIVKLIVMTKQGKIIFGNSKIYAPHGDAAVDAALNGDGNIIIDVFLRQNRTDNIVGNPGTYVKHVVFFEFHQRTSSDHLAFIERKRMVVIYFVVLLYIDRSKLGYALKTIREDEETAHAVGIGSFKYKFIATFISAGMIAVVGVFHACYVGYINADVFKHSGSLDYLMPAIIGGIGTVVGPVLGAGILTPLSEWLNGALSQVAGLNLLVYAVIVIIVILFRPTGIMGWYSRSDFKKKVNARFDAIDAKLFGKKEG